MTVAMRVFYAGNRRIQMQSHKLHAKPTVERPAAMQQGAGDSA